MKSEIRLLKDIKFNDNSIFRAESIFDNLYDNDNGMESPNVSNKFLFANIGLQSIEPYTKLVGMPYKWCQYLCGLFYDNKEAREALISQGSDLTNTNQKEDMAVENGGMEVVENDESLVGGASSSSESQQHLSETKMFERIISRLKTRFKARICLQEIINQLKNSKLPTLDSVAAKAIKFPIQSSITEFRESDFEKYSSLSYTRPFKHVSFINEQNCMFYELQSQKADATLHAQIVVHQDYPKTVPLFSVNVNWKHDRNFSNDDAIRDMERNINLLCDQFMNDDSSNVKSSSSGKNLGATTSVNIAGGEKANDILAKQIYQLLVYFDIYLLTESNYLSSNEIYDAKLFSNPVRGRDRQRPYMYLSDKNLFVQRVQKQ